jgi:hypothetical protein
LIAAWPYLERWYFGEYQGLILFPAKRSTQPPYLVCAEGEDNGGIA